MDLPKRWHNPFEVFIFGGILACIILGVCFGVKYKNEVEESNKTVPHKVCESMVKKQIPFVSDWCAGNR
jgi:hypothetical protein